MSRWNVIAVSGWLLLICTAVAQDEPDRTVLRKSEQPPVAQETQEDSPSPESNTANPMSVKQLYELCDQMGLEPEWDNEENPAYVMIDFRHGDVVYPLHLWAHENNDMIFGFGEVTTFEDPAAVSPLNLLNLIAKQGSHFPIHFSYAPEDKTLWIRSAFPNKNVKAAALRKFLEGFVSGIQATQSAWAISDWTVPQGDAAPPAPESN